MFSQVFVCPQGEWWKGVYWEGGGEGLWRMGGVVKGGGEGGCVVVIDTPLDPEADTPQIQR